MTSVTFAIVCYKSNEVLPALLASIKNQQGSFARQVVIIDNYSADNCSRIVQGAFSEAKLIINQSNLGYTAAVNQANAAAHGEFVFLLNPDIELHPDCTQIMLDSLAANPDLAAVAPQLRYPDGTIQPSVRNFPTFSTLIYEHSGLACLFPRNSVFGRWKNRSFDHKTRTGVTQPMASALLIRREVLAQIGSWDEQFFVYFSDVDYCRRIAAAGYHILFEPAAQAGHRLGDSARREGGWLVRDSHRGFYRYLCKHELRGARTLLRPLAWLILSVSAELRILLKQLRK